MRSETERRNLFLFLFLFLYRDVNKYPPACPSWSGFLGYKNG
jgi:hypothetical protein